MWWIWKTLIISAKGSLSNHENSHLHFTHKACFLKRAKPTFTLKKSPHFRHRTREGVHINTFAEFCRDYSSVHVHVHHLGVCSHSTPNRLNNHPAHVFDYTQYGNQIWAQTNFRSVREGCLLHSTVSTACQGEKKGRITFPWRTLWLRLGNIATRPANTADQ